eukprot:3922649-Rhodomonas_salina.1
MGCAVLRWGMKVPVHRGCAAMVPVCGTKLGMVVWDARCRCIEAAIMNPPKPGARVEIMNQ